MTLSRLPIEIAFACDAAYLPHAAAMIESALHHHASDQLRFHLLAAPDVADSRIQELLDHLSQRAARLVVHRIDPSAVSALPATRRISSVMWYRLLLPALLPDQDRVLYLDCDTLVVDDLRPLWQTALGDTPLGAVRNVFEPQHRKHPQRLGLDAPGGCFNSGVLLMALDQWRESGLASAVVEVARQRPRLAWPDQDALNIVFAGRWQALHPRWNTQNSYYFLADARQQLGTTEWHTATRTPGIVHFEGGLLAKPWHRLCKHPYRQAYFEYRARTPWPHFAMEGDTLLNRVLRHLPASTLLGAFRLRERATRRLRQLRRALQ